MDDSDLALVPGKEQQKAFKINLERLRKEKPIVLVHLPDDEYGKDGKCMPVSTGSIHVNTQGYVEPCPFAHFARENTRINSFSEILQSPFLEAVRRHPTLLKRDSNCYGCSLAGNRKLLEEVAQQTGAKSTEISSSSVYNR
jgi:MoaA/NifB/PqqE/SkfB family radical SAM enzyme